MSVLGLALVGALVAPSPALACGGFFCSSLEPVDQSAERILFAVDEQQGTVTAHVQIFFEGDADDFAWVVPVPSVPELFLSTDSLFSVLDERVGPRFDIREDRSSCTSGDERSYAVDAVYSASESGGVNVVSTGQVGPYDTVVLQATDAFALSEWLAGHGFDLPDGVDEALTPYLAEGQYLVALRLSKDRSSGEIAPIGLRWSASSVMVPIRLTSIAARPDMRLEVYVLGPSRAVPESYLHVVINDAMINWWTGGANYDDVVTQAANEASGHAFATDWTGSTEGLRGSLYREGGYGVSGFSRTDRQDFMDDLMSSGLPSSQYTLNLLQIYMPLPSDFPATNDPSSYYDCVSCYGDPSEPFDADGLITALEDQVVGPLSDAEDLFWVYPHLTRMTSSLDAVEMTVDPSFVFNADMAQEMEQLRVASMYYDCAGTVTSNAANRRFTLPDGRMYFLPSEDWFASAGISEFDYLQEHLTDVAANIIERTGPEGLPEAMYDRTAEALDESLRFNDAVGELLGCAGGCSGAGRGGGVALTAGALALLARRRRS